MNPVVKYFNGEKAERRGHHYMEYLKEFSEKL